MRKIKMFESHSVELFCKDYLVDLVDANWEVYVTEKDTTLGTGNIFSLSDKESNISSFIISKNWSDIKNSFIPFIEVFSETYNIVTNIVLSGEENIIKTVTDIISDNVDDNIPIESVVFRFNKKSISENSQVVINESNKISELTYICKDYLVDLTDNDFHIVIDENEHSKGLYYLSIRRYTSVEWRSIGDSFMSFIEIFSNSYTVIEIAIRGYTTNTYRLNDILEKEPEDYTLVSNIQIMFYAI